MGYHNSMPKSNKITLRLSPHVDAQQAAVKFPDANSRRGRPVLIEQTERFAALPEVLKPD